MPYYCILYIILRARFTIKGAQPWANPEIGNPRPLFWGRGAQTLTLTPENAALNSPRGLGRKIYTVVYRSKSAPPVCFLLVIKIKRFEHFLRFLNSPRPSHPPLAYLGSLKRKLVRPSAQLFFPWMKKYAHPNYTLYHNLAPCLVVFDSPLLRWLTISGFGYPLSFIIKRAFEVYSSISWIQF